jgi:hypothetical protein
MGQPKRRPKMAIRDEFDDLRREVAAGLSVWVTNPGIVPSIQTGGRSDPSGSLQGKHRQGLPWTARQPSDREERDDRYLSSHE